jgi:rhodanese-related sulfurtransferase
MISVKELIAQANARIPTLPVDQALGLVSDSGTLFVDLRDSTEIARDGRIPGALHVNRGMLEFALDPATPYHQPALAAGKRVVLYCASGGRSALAADTARAMGRTDICHLAGGFKAWVAAGGPRLDGAIA